jgi:ABC-2 type transport system ATP-binding protein
MIQLRNLSKSFKGKSALQGLSLEIARGEIFGLLGHNGAGKSTAFGLLLGQLYPDSGEAWINGISVQRHRAEALARVGAIFETPGFYEYLTGWRNLEILAHYSGEVSRATMLDAVETVGLTARIHEPVRVYSHGMRQRLALAQALIPAPEMVLLDEPTEGLDPEGIHEMRSLIQKLNRERGLTVVLSSHLLAEVEQLCDRVAILNQGRLIFDGRWAELRAEGQRYRFDVDDPGKLMATGVMRVRDDVVELPPGREVSDIVAELVRAGVRIRAVEPIRRNLETVYLELISHEAPAGRSHDGRAALL